MDRVGEPFAHHAQPLRRLLDLLNQQPDPMNNVVRDGGEASRRVAASARSAECSDGGIAQNWARTRHPNLYQYQLELEGNSTGVHQLRHGVITSTCDAKVIHDGDRQFYCENLKGSPFSVIIVSNRDRQTLTYLDKSPGLDISNNPFVTYYLSSRSICGWKLDPLSPWSRFGALPNVECEDDLRLPYALTDALKGWADSWPHYGE
ncbi:unnamed protein product [Heligmosomoides polygyrus]|uniref:Ricin B-type lectin domain-containing protein n=1 Tax=Heligmosomoides polygyrus TaxID=6339 RepID=A0A183GPG1_HELPZ|nr:unnamed protein product [Heligmosomoides polygyrus]